MSFKQCCSLCCTSCNDYKLLQNQMGDSNEVYEITVKYFDPMLLMEEGNTKQKELKVLCHDCWFHIKDFHKFQQNVIMTRNSLERNIRRSQVKLEHDIENEECREDLEVNDNLDKSEEYEDNDNNFGDVCIQKNYEENTDDNLLKDSINENDEEDGKPLIALTKTRNELKKTDSTENPNEQGNPKTRRVRKTKNFIKANLQKESNEEKPTSKTKKFKLTEDTKNDESNLEKGMESDNFIAEWKPELECDMCGEFSTSFQQLRQHFKEKHKTRCYIKCCERKFYRRYVLVEHIRLHLNPELYKCDICGKPCSSKYYIKLHKKIVHENNEQFECEVCHKMFVQKATLDRHMLTHAEGSKDFVCQECSKAYVLEIQLKYHMKAVHNVDRVCEQCGKTIHGAEALKKHLMEHAGIKKPQYPCDKCGNELNTRNSLRRHMAAYHHDGSTIYVCSICEKVAASQSALLRHKKNVHEAERKHKCTYCDKAFKRPKVLREHIATHTGQDLYQCPHCSQTFKVSANMHHHRKKMHPIEWEEGRKNRLQFPKVDINQIKNQVVI